MNATTLVAPAGGVERAFLVLRILATAGKRGLALIEIADQTRLPNSTVHRLLHRLQSQNIVIQDFSTKRYRLGRLAYELGLAANAMFDLRDDFRQTLQQLAEKVEDTVYLTVRSGIESVCEGRYEGPSPIRVVTLDIGSRRLLGIGAGGLAILANMPEQERLDMAIEIAARLNGERSEEDLLQSVERCRRDGYAFIRNRVTAGVAAVGVPVLNSLDMPFAAISVAATTDRMPSGRVEKLAHILQLSAREIRKSIINKKLYQYH